MSKIIDLIKKYKEIILYIIVGVLTTAVSFSVQWLFTDVILVNVVTKATIASIIAWITSVLFAFFANKLIVFERKQRKGFFKEFKDFAMRGNVIDLAQGMTSEEIRSRVISAEKF